MNTNKTTARIVGALFLTTFVTNLIGSGIIESILNAPDYLINLYPKKTQMIIAVLLELIDAAAVVGIAVMLFPILKKHNKNIALGYLGFRIIESVFLIISEISPLPLLTLSQEFIKAGAPDASYFQALGNLVVAQRYLAFEMVRMLYFLTALMFFYSSYQSKLLPRFLSVWGLIGTPLGLTASMLQIIGLGTGMILFLPGGLTEPFLAIWLIVKGFNSSAIVSESAKTDINED